MKIRLWPKRRPLRILLLLFAVSVLPSAFSRLASPSRVLSLHCSGDARLTKTRDPTARFRIACYNIAHGRGIAESNWDGGDPEERADRLDRIANLLQDVDADIVVLNEVDFESSWSHSRNQAEFLAAQGGYPYWVEQRNLDLRILGWTWRFGNAVLSKHPITDAQIVQLPAYSRWETILAGKKRGIVCDISLDSRPIRVVGVHLSHRSESVRASSAAMLSDIANDSVLPTIVAGDMNSTPPGFPNSITDANGDNAMDTFDRSKQFRRSPKDPSGDNGFTFHSVDPRSVIDWILIPRDWYFVDYGLRSSKLSDHRLVYADVMTASN